jgi:iron uptake system EfeUOB component EfeO/EfeM
VVASAAAPALATYTERAPHVLSRLTVLQGVQAGVGGAPSAPASELPPVSAAAFRAPIAAYRVFAGRRLAPMQRQIADLEAALQAGDRSAAQTAWRGAFFDYLGLGAVYLEGPVAALNQAIDGTAGGVAGGASSPRFSGLHRLELGLWTEAGLQSLLPWARRLSADVDRLGVLLRTVAIPPADYATRAHEILENAVRDLLSGTDVPWSGEGVLGTAAGLDATQEVISTLRGVLGRRESVLSVVHTQLSALHGALASIQTAHGGRLPTDAQLTQDQSEMLQSAIGGALEALAQVPGALETTTTPATPQIPAAAARTDP